MLLDKAIWTYLSGIAALVAKVPAESIQWGDAEQETAVPRVVYRRISSPSLYDATDQWQRWEIITVHTDKYEAQAIGVIISDSLHRFKGADQGTFGGMAVDYIEKIEDRDPQLRTDGRYELIQEYRFIFH